MRWLSPVSLLAALVVTTGLEAQSAGADSATMVLEQASRRYQALHTLCADFVQTRTVPLLEQVTRSRGRICQKDPDLFLMDFSDPEGDVVVADGEHLWIYYRSMDPKQVIRQPLLSGSGGRFDFHREFLADPGSKYVPEYLGTDVVDGRRAHVVRLTPRAASVYREARVWIDEDRWLIRKVDIVEENDSRREVILSEIIVNPDIDEARFAFTPPPGTQIIRR